MAILLTIEIGNTTTCMALMQEEKLLGTFRLSTIASHTTDEIRIFMRNFLMEHHLDTDQIHDAIVASVVPEKTDHVLQAVEMMFGIHPIVIGPGVKTGIQLRFENAKEIGSDRIVNAAAAHKKYGRSCIVIDFGTATTFDYVDARGVFEYTIIMPGIEISAGALKAAAAKLPGIEIKRPDKILARNTVSGMQAGLTYGYIGAVDAILKEMKIELKDNCWTVATGELAETIARECTEIDAYEKGLAPLGMRYIYDLNKDKRHS